ncbi:hypothetical protein [Liquorilactobacillus vini]|uniref:DUF202 domain-containing protein n=1 Tax=Liquorilactobacillus vini DSM 20605 TaxID=1133569 RepID=A0A0R2CK58_9LACO|nr:hypothetical protein [Liquorilactobacillus vini]KRM88921.1 hypothetical protein FD21_GL000559 [Liquorilactobacillus vini DSM 20605]
MKKKDLIKGYKTEILYQKHMLENLQRWFSLFLGCVGIGIIMVYFFHATNLPLKILGIILIVIGSIGMLIFGSGIYHGNHNLQLVIKDFKLKLSAKSMPNYSSPQSKE